MAEIRIKKKRPIWPWLLLLVIIGALVFLYFYGSMDNDEEINSDKYEEVGHLSSLPSAHYTLV
jgi:type VI protein secretion system component VasF